MRTVVGWLWIAGVFGLVAGAQAQAPSPADTQFDGSYTLVSAAKVNQTYRTRGGQMGQCADRSAGPLSIAQGQAQYTTETGYQLRGPVGPQGELSMRSLAPPGSNGFRPIEIVVNGAIDGAGTARIRQTGNSCSYDFVWQKQAR